MSTEYQAQMVVGCYLQDVDRDQTEYLEDTEALREIDTEYAYELLMEVVYGGDVWDYINEIGK